MKIYINGVETTVYRHFITYEEICAIARQPTCASCTYHWRKPGTDIKRSGILYVGKSVELEEGMDITCIVTGNA